MSLVGARRTHQRLSGRRVRGSLEKLRVTGLLNVEHRGSTAQSVTSARQFVSARELGSRRSETAQPVASARQLVPAREPGSSKGSRRSETAQAVASAGQFVSAGEPGRRKGPRRSETAQAVASAGSLCLPGNRVEKRPEAFGDCTGRSIGGKFVLARKPGSSKGSRRSKSAEAA